MNDLRIVDWAEWDENKYPPLEFKSEKHRMEVLSLVASELRKNGYYWSGEYHQNGECGAPVFNDGTQLSLSFRGWGGVMAMAYPDEIDDSDGLGYCEYAWYNPDKKHVVPNSSKNKN